MRDTSEKRRIPMFSFINIKRGLCCLMAFTEMRLMIVAKTGSSLAAAAFNDDSLSL